MQYGKSKSVFVERIIGVLRLPRICCLVGLLAFLVSLPACSDLKHGGMEHSSLVKDTSPRPGSLVASYQVLEHDFGIVAPAGTLEHSFSISNPTQSGWTVSSVRTNCVCTVSGIDKDMIQPGGVAQVNVAYTTPAKSGSYSQSVLVSFDGDDSSHFELRVLARVREDMTINPQNVSFKIVKGDSSTTRRAYVTVRNYGGFHWEQLEPTLIPRWLKLIPDDAAENGNASQSFGYQVSVETASLETGRYVTEVRFIGKGAGDHELSNVMNVNLDVVSPLTMSPSRVFLGKVNSNSLQKYNVIVSMREGYEEQNEPEVDYGDGASVTLETHQCTKMRENLYRYSLQFRINRTSPGVYVEQEVLAFRWGDLALPLPVCYEVIDSQ